MGKMVLPGDQVAVSEEYEAGKGTYEEGGLVYASMTGTLELDAENRVVRVKPFNPPAELNVGDIVYGAIGDIRSSMVTAVVELIHGRTRQVSGETEGSVHISKISDRYTEDIRSAMRGGDIIRARVIQVRPSLQLSTADRTLGVVRALCSTCRAPLVRRGEELYCERDERTELRKIADDYGDLQLDAPAEALGGGKIEAPPRQEERRGGPGRGRGGGRERRGGDRRGRGRGGPPRGGRRPRGGGG